MVRRAFFALKARKEMKRLEKIARRALHWAAVYRKDGDSDGERAAMSRYRKAQAAINALVGASFCQHIDLTGVLG